MNEKKIKPRVRLIIIKNGKILLSYIESNKYYFYIGGKIEYGETVLQAAQREINEECGGAKFTFKKILYVRDYIKPEQNDHSLELYILGEIDKFKEVEKIRDQEHPDHYQTWVDINKLAEIDVRPKSIVDRLIDGYQNGFSDGTKYLGEID